jgi:hypothetical protein
VNGSGIERAIEDIRGREVPWDELRQRRVLAAIEARRKSGDRTAAPVRSPGRVVAIGLSIAAALALVVGGAFALRSATSESASIEPASIDLGVAIAEPVAASAHTPAIPHVDPPRLTLVDGSVAQLAEAARVDVVVQSPDLVQLLQHDGRVRYEVAPDPDRRFVVDAAGVEVRVVGTIFAVEVAGEHVVVGVERGVVEVAAGDRVTRLEAGEELRVEAPDDDIVIEADTELEAHAREAVRPKARASAPVPSIEELLDEADSARARGDASRAAAALSELVSRYPRDPRAYSASFQLGKVQRGRGLHAAAARAFSACVRRAPKGALAEDARAEAAASFSAAGEHEKARKAAEAYLAQYPAGTHAGRMRLLLKPSE